MRLVAAGWYSISETIVSKNFNSNDSVSTTFSTQTKSCSKNSNRLEHMGTFCDPIHVHLKKSVTSCAQNSSFLLSLLFHYHKLDRMKIEAISLIERELLRTKKWVLCKVG